MSALDDANSVYSDSEQEENTIDRSIFHNLNTNTSSSSLIKIKKNSINSGIFIS